MVPLMSCAARVVARQQLEGGMRCAVLRAPRTVATTNSATAFSSLLVWGMHTPKKRRKAFFLPRWGAAQLMFLFLRLEDKA